MRSPRAQARGHDLGSRSIPLAWSAHATTRCEQRMPAPATQASRARALRILVRAIVVVVGLWLSGWLLNRLATGNPELEERPGFVAGLAHGALMPMALPRLALGTDVMIYAVPNSGRAY